MTDLKLDASGRNAEVDMTSPLPVVSSDSHAGPRLVEDLRPYCPTGLLDRYDDFVAGHLAEKASGGAMRLHANPRRMEQTRQNQRTAGHHDVGARLHDMDVDGIAAAVLFHGSQNGEPLPWEWGLARVLGGGDDTAEQRELMAAGRHIYNEWLADLCSVQPERHIGCAQVPTWDIDATLRELQWACEHGLHAVNWPAPRSDTREYDDPAWEPVWATCEALEMTLNTHSGAVVPGLLGGEPVAHRYPLIQLEAGSWPSRRGMHRMLMSGVFERHPRLKIVLTEVAGGWWPQAVREMDSAWHDNYDAVREIVPRPPSEYLHANVFIGASFIANFEVEEAIRERFSENVLWGQDYPHAEGAWSYREDGLGVTRLHLRYAFCAAPPIERRRMLSDNAISVYGLDRPALQRVADRIGGPTLTELGVPIDAEPDTYTKGFRKLGPFA